MSSWNHSSGISRNDGTDTSTRQKSSSPAASNFTTAEPLPRDTADMR